MIKIYVLHHRDKSFEKRLVSISKRLNEEKLDFDIIDLYKPEDIDYERLMYNHEMHPKIIIENYNLEMSYINFSKKINIGSLSLILKHSHCWQDQVDNDYDYTLILEDDCEIPYNFNLILSQILDEAKKKKCELVMVGGFGGFIAQDIKQNEILHYNHMQKTRCTHAYLISKSCASVMLQRLQNYNLPIDFKMNEIIQLEKIKVFWYEPGLKQKNFND